MTHTKLTATIILTLVLGACGGGEERAKEMADQARDKVDQVLPDQPPGDIGEAIEMVGDALAGADQSVAAADLKALLPEQLAGLGRVSYEAQKAGVGITVSKAQATYGDADNQISLLITDLGAASALVAMSRNMFQNEVDKEDETGFERTTEYKGHKSYQRVLRMGDQSLSEIMVFVDERFTVQLDGQNIEWDDMLAALDQIDVEALASMATTTTASN